MDNVNVFYKVHWSDFSLHCLSWKQYFYISKCEHWTYIMYVSSRASSQILFNFFPKWIFMNTFNLTMTHKIERIFFNNGSKIQPSWNHLCNLSPSISMSIMSLNAHHFPIVLSWRTNLNPCPCWVIWFFWNKSDKYVLLNGKHLIICKTCL